MRPRHVAGEAPQELAADDRRRLALLRRVVEVAVAALDELGVLVVQGQTPQLLAGRVARRDDALDPVVVGPHHAGVCGAERDDDPAGEGGHVDEPLGALLARVRQAVAEDEASLGVRVVDLDGQALLGAHDVARLDRVPAGQVLGRADHGDDAHG